jgi:hypothetical protein
MTDDIVERLRTEWDRFSRVPTENKFWLGPLVHARLAVLFLESANHICHLRNERDEARREVSELKANEANRLSSAIRLKGWICFEEVDNA